MRIIHPLLRPLFWSLAFAAFALSWAGVAQAVPDDSGTTTINEPNGFPGVCAAPCYSVLKSFEFWRQDNLGNPMPSALPGYHTYIYKLEHIGGSGPFVPAVTAFKMNVDTASVSEIGYVAGSPGIIPSSTATGPFSVTWNFVGPVINNGESSALLYVHSRLLPGGVTDNIVGIEAQLALDAPGTCKGPFLEPPAYACSMQVQKEACVVQPPDVPGDSCDGKVTSFSFQYTGLGCAASSNLQNPKKTKCKGGAIGQQPVSVIVVGKKRKRWSWDHGWWGRKHHKKTVFAAQSGVHVGDVIVADASNAGKHTLGSKTYVKISYGDGHHDIIELDKFHTSCSQPFAPGNQFGSVKILSVTSTLGGTATLPLPEDGDPCETSIDVVPPPHCEGKVQSLSLRYTGSDCAATMTTQDPSKVSCVDSLASSANPVQIIVKDSGSGTVLFDQNPVNGGEIVVAAATNGGLSQLNSTTAYWIKNAVTGALIQNGYFHTSCSQPLNLGDQIGALQVFGIDTTQGGSVALGSDVEYTYTVTNPNDQPVDSVSVDDDILGNIASGVTIAAGVTEVFTTTALIEQETTNIVTVTGNVGPTVCTEGTASATITVAAPSVEPTICTQKIAAVLFRYTGPDILGATVIFSAKSFQDEPVVYGPVDLIGGATVLSMTSENGYTIDGAAHGETGLGSKLTISINGVPEVIHTSCSVPFASDAAAPLDDPKGDPSANWFVVDFTEKQKSDDHHHH